MARAKKQNQEKNSGKMAAQKTVRDNALAKVVNIIENAKAAENFFYEEMAPKMSAIASSYNSSFNVDITAEDVATATYLSCWDSNWAKLRAFKGETTIHAWVARIASQATYQFLVEEHYIDGVGKTKTNDYRLKILGIENELLRKEIVGLVYIPEMHKALDLYYVKKVSEKELAVAFKNEKEAKKWLKAGQKTLIEQLLNTENPYAEMALSLKKAINPETPFQTWHDRIDEELVSENHLSLRDILMSIFQNEDWDENAMALINSVLKELSWSDVQEKVWRERFFKNTPSKELAEKFHVRNTWIDNTYSRLNKQFNIAVRNWWKNIS